MKSESLYSIEILKTGSQKLNSLLSLPQISFQELKHQVIRCFKEDFSPTPTRIDTDSAETMTKCQSIILTDPKSTTIKEMENLELMEMEVRLSTMNQIQEADQLQMPNTPSQL